MTKLRLFRDKQDLIIKVLDLKRNFKLGTFHMYGINFILYNFLNCPIFSSVILYV